jgi:hypothetical protein
MRRSSARREARGIGIGIGLGSGGILIGMPNLSGMLKVLKFSRNLLLMKGAESFTPERFITLATPPPVAFLYIGPTPQGFESWRRRGLGIEDSIPAKESPWQESILYIAENEGCHHCRTLT